MSSIFNLRSCIFNCLLSLAVENLLYFLYLVLGTLRLPVQICRLVLILSHSIVHSLVNVFIEAIILKRGAWLTLAMLLAFDLVFGSVFFCES